MKKIVFATVASIAMIAATAPATASTHNSYPGVYGNASGVPYSNPIWAGYSPDGIPDDNEAASGTVQNAFTLSGTVSKDCSYFGGPSTSHAIPLGAIGVRTAANDLVSNVFNQAADFSYDIATTTAGCNFNNTVTVTKSVDGLKNAAAGGFDSSQFTDHIPYSVLVGLTATTNTSAGAVGAYVPMTVAANSGSNSEHLGAWRSGMHVKATFPAQTKGLVAGDYTDTINVTLAVDA
jgi:hypothetical protein